MCVVMKLVFMTPDTVMLPNIWFTLANSLQRGRKCQILTCFKYNGCCASLIPPKSLYQNGEHLMTVILFSHYTRKRHSAVHFNSF